jgi:hypothetical protein
LGRMQHPAFWLGSCTGSRPQVVALAQEQPVVCHGAAPRAAGAGGCGRVQEVWVVCVCGGGGNCDDYTKLWSRRRMRLCAVTPLEPGFRLRRFEEHCWNGWDSDYRRWRDCFSDEVMPQMQHNKHGARLALHPASCPLLRLPVRPTGQIGPSACLHAAAACGHDLLLLPCDMGSTGTCTLPRPRSTHCPPAALLCHSAGQQGAGRRDDLPHQRRGMGRLEQGGSAPEGIQVRPLASQPALQGNCPTQKLSTPAAPAPAPPLA